jgi:5-methylcytosine-specific restriction endonuclease McrA
LARIARLRDDVPVLRPAVAVLGREEAQRDRLREDRGWYKTARWQRLRWQVLVRARFTCAMCGRLEADTARLVADHVVPHRGRAALFWDDANLQCLCKPCHDGAKQRAEGGVKTLHSDHG